MDKVSLQKPVPDFVLPATSNHVFRLSDYRGKYLVLYFYPKDCTSGCTLESQQFRDNFAKFQQHNTLVFGISRDTLKLHEKFIQEQTLPFPLLSDTEEIACHLFDVIRDKTMYGKKVRGIERSTFLIDKDGILIAEWRKVSPDGHANEVLERLAAL